MDGTVARSILIRQSVRIGITAIVTSGPYTYEIASLGERRIKEERNSATIYIEDVK